MTGPTTGLRAARSDSGPDSGSVAVEFVIVVPVVISAMFLAIQVALYSYARSVALTAAQEGANAARAYQATPANGRERAETFLENARDGLSDATITITSTEERVTVTVTGHSLSVIPGFDGFTVTQSASGPRERFVP